METLSLGNVLDALVPISRFNKGEANKIFDEVNEVGCKVVLKNNSPACVLMSPAKYRAFMNEIDELRLHSLVAERLMNYSGNAVAHEEVMSNLGISQEELDTIPMEHGVDFE